MNTNDEHYFKPGHQNKQKMNLLIFLIPCAPEVQLTHRFIFRAIEWRLQPSPQAERIDCEGQKSSHVRESSLSQKSSLVLYLSEKYSLLNPSMCDLMTAVPVHCCQFTLRICEFLTDICWNYQSLCRKLTQERNFVFIFHPQVSGWKNQRNHKKNAVNIGIPLLGRDSSLNTGNKVRSHKYLSCVQIFIWMSNFMSIRIFH